MELTFSKTRKTKPSDIFRQQKNYSYHLQKLAQIHTSPSPTRQFQQQSKSQLLYYSELLKKPKSNNLSPLMFQNTHKNKHFSSNKSTQYQNSKLLSKIFRNADNISTNKNSAINPQNSSSMKRFNSYWSNRKSKWQFENQNTGIVNRLLSTQSLVPHLKQLKQQFKQKKKLAQNLKKFNGMIKREGIIRKKLTQQRKYKFDRIKYELVSEQ